MNYKNLIAQNIANYQLLDSGDGEKLEILCGVTMIRPCPQAIWHKKYKKELWQKATSICRRTKGGGGEWKHNKKLPTPLHYSFDMHGKKLNLDLKLTAFGHCGLFFEQWALWPVFYNKVLDLKEKLGRAPKVLNLFAYTGGASIVCAAAGAQVEHVDSAKGVIKWGQENQKLSNLKRESISWQVQDAFNQVKFYQKKSISFDSIIADQPR